MTSSARNWKGCAPPAALQSPERKGCRLLLSPVHKALFFTSRAGKHPKQVTQQPAGPPPAAAGGPHPQARPLAREGPRRRTHTGRSYLPTGASEGHLGPRFEIPFKTKHLYSLSHLGGAPDPESSGAGGAGSRGEGPPTGRGLPRGGVACG